MRVLLVSPPWRIPSQGTLAIATLRPILEAAGHVVEELHGSLLFPAGGSDMIQLFMGHSRYAFGRALGDRDVDAYAEQVLQCQLGEINSHGAVTGDDTELAQMAGFDPEELRAQIADSIRKADLCLDRCVAAILAAPAYDVIGFTTMFDDQIPAAVMIARRVKQEHPQVKVVFGGPACFEEQAEGLLASFSEIDAICHAEGESVVVPLIEALGFDRALAEVRGIAFRDGDTIVRTESPELLRDMDSLPRPDFHEFIEQHARSEWASNGAQLFYETSRGCWWGQKSLCSFCGLNGGGLSYRSKSPDRAYQEIVEIYRNYPTVNSMLATDNILDMEYLKQVFPRLAKLEEDPDRPLRLFYEVKSNMRRDQIEVMSAGGVRGVQPGIESFSDQILDVMRKGCTALGQVQFIKWAHQSGAEPFYNVLVLNPGETTAAYRAMLDLVPFLTHLPHPQAVVTMLLERFSPYFSEPTKFGIRNVRPKPFYAVVFGQQIDQRLAYQFDYDHDMFGDKGHLVVVRELVAVLQRWQNTYRPDTLYYVEDAEHVDIVDLRGGVMRTTLTGSAAELFRFLDQHRAVPAIHRAFPELPGELIEATLEQWLHRRWVCRVDDRYLAVVPRKGPHPIREMTASRELTAPRELVRLRMVS